MKVKLEKINLNNLDKSNWESFRFEEITYRVSEGVDPNTTTLEKYVGLEHIDAENIHIKRFGIPDDVSGGKLKCYPGDVIFGKRRAYQRKAAIADFEGICSAHAFVFRANPEIIDPKLFPFFLHSDQFMHRAVDISVGGLSPTINWGDLKHQEFLLPPKIEQARLAELLWAVDEVIEKEIELLNKLKSTLYSYTKHLFENEESKIQIKHFVTNVKSKKAMEGIIPYLEIGDINIDNKTIEFKSKESVKGSIIANDNSILISKVRPNRGAICFLKESNIVSNGFAVIQPKSIEVNPKYLFYCLAWNLNFFNLMARLATGSTYPTISDDDILNYCIPSLNLIEQNKYTSKMDNVYLLVLKLESKISDSQSLQKSLINKIF